MKQFSANNPYCGFELGPIRPPSEARSLLLRVTRNCSWNRCTFCPVYKTDRFSIRPAEHVIRDIDLIYKQIETMRELSEDPERITSVAIQRASDQVAPDEWNAFTAAANWVTAGDMRSVFLQDADSLVIKPLELVSILNHLKMRFPTIQRITSYARAKTIARKKEEDLTAIRRAGLDRIHIGLESGSDKVLALVKKGSTKAVQVEAGRRVKRAGMELSEYVMPGLGGRNLSRIHALETADALNQIDPDFIRIRTLAIPPSAPLYQEWQAGGFEKCSDLMIAKELVLFIEHLDGITSTVTSDHILNLFMDLIGRLPDDKKDMLDIVKTFLEMDPEEQRRFQVGRRLGIFHRIGDYQNPRKVEAAKAAYRKLGVTPENIDEITDQLMMRFV
jgi:hypothetical protein